MNTCDTCKWWGPKVSLIWDIFKECRLRKEKDISPKSDSIDGGPNVTGPKFGCIHHEPK